MATFRPAARQPVRRPTSGSSAISRMLDSTVRSVCPAPFQEAALAPCAKWRCFLVARPHWRGKTWIAEQAISELLAARGSAWYTTPLKAPLQPEVPSLYGCTARVGGLSPVTKAQHAGPRRGRDGLRSCHALYDGRLSPTLICVGRGDTCRIVNADRVGEILLLRRRAAGCCCCRRRFPMRTSSRAGSPKSAAPPRGHRERVRPVPLRYVLADARADCFPRSPEHLPTHSRLRGGDRLMREAGALRLLPSSSSILDDGCAMRPRESWPDARIWPELRAAALARWEREFPVLRTHAFRSPSSIPASRPTMRGTRGVASGNGRLAGARPATRRLRHDDARRSLDVPPARCAIDLVGNSPDGPVVLTSHGISSMSVAQGGGARRLGVVVLPASPG